MAFNDEMVNLVLKVFDNSLIAGVVVSIDATYRSVTTGSYNPATGTLTRPSVDYPVKIIKKNDSTIPKSGPTSLSNTTDVRDAGSGVDYLEFLIRPVDSILPAQGIDDELLIEDKMYKVMTVDSVNLGEDRLMYKVKAVG